LVHAVDQAGYMSAVQRLFFLRIVTLRLNRHQNDKYCGILHCRLNGSMVYWLAHLEFELGDPGSTVWLPGRATIPLGILFHSTIPFQPRASCLLTLPPQFLSSKELGYERQLSAP